MDHAHKKQILYHTRKDFGKHRLDETHVHRDPFRQFEDWFKEAHEAEGDLANAMTLATVGADGMPGARVVLLRDISHGGFTFFTNYKSRKGEDIAHHPKVSLLFFWKELERQVRIEGEAGMLPMADSDAYFESRPYESRVGAWASEQSQVVDSRKSLERLYHEQTDRFAGKHVPRPEHWGGYVVKPVAFEFWQGRPSRLHDRLRYSYQADSDNWNMERLMP